MGTGHSNMFSGIPEQALGHAAFATVVVEKIELAKWRKRHHDEDSKALA
jgi:hypothetical protein